MKIFIPVVFAIAVILFQDCVCPEPRRISPEKQAPSEERITKPSPEKQVGKPNVPSEDLTKPENPEQDKLSKAIEDITSQPGLQQDVVGSLARIIGSLSQYGLENSPITDMLKGLLNTLGGNEDNDYVGRNDIAGLGEMATKLTEAAKNAGNVGLHTVGSLAKRGGEALGVPVQIAQAVHDPIKEFSKPLQYIPVIGSIRNGVHDMVDSGLSTFGELATGISSSTGKAFKQPARRMYQNDQRFRRQPTRPNRGGYENYDRGYGSLIPKSFDLRKILEEKNEFTY